MTTAAPSEWGQGTLLLDDFQIERHLGRGGMGDVYLARSHI